MKQDERNGVRHIMGIEERRKEESQRRRVLLLGDMERLNTEKREGLTNGNFLDELLRAVRRAAHCELTERQKSCFALFYDEGKSVRQIARQLGLNDSTVSRHLAAARGKVRRYTSYCAFGRTAGGGGEESHFVRGG